MILNSHNSLPQSTAAKGAAATLWCLICNIAASNLLICISGGTICLSCSSGWVCVASQSVCLSLNLFKLLFTVRIYILWGTSGLEWNEGHVSGKESVKIIDSLRGTNISCKQCNLIVSCWYGCTYVNYHGTKGIFVLTWSAAAPCLPFSNFLLHCYYLWKTATDIPITGSDTVCRKQSVPPVLPQSRHYISWMRNLQFTGQHARDRLRSVCL